MQLLDRLDNPCGVAPLSYSFSLSPRKSRIMMIEPSVTLTGHALTRLRLHVATQSRSSASRHAQSFLGMSEGGGPRTGRRYGGSSRDELEID